MADYWNHVQEDLVYKWGKANQQQQFKIYDELFKSVRHMAASILGRYFMYSPDNREIQQDAINKLFCEMHKFDPEKGKTAYSYCQTILKNYYHDVAKNKRGRKFAVVLEYVDDIESPEFNYSYEWQPYEEDNRFEPVFKRLEQARYKLMCYLADHKKVPKGTRKMVQREIEFLCNTTEFLYTYKDSGVDTKCIHENAMIKSGLSEPTIQKYTKKHLGFTVWLSEDYESKLEKKHSIYYMDDDWTPDTQPIVKEKIRKQNKYIHQQYNE